MFDAPVISTDWPPTLLDLCGVKTTDTFDGASFAPVLAGKEANPRPLYWHVPHYTNQGSRPAGAVRSGKWKLIEHYEDGRVELFDLSSDPGETADLAAAIPQETDLLRKQLAVWRNTVKAQENTPNPKFDPARHTALYVDTDVSKLTPAATAKVTGAPLADWRKRMDEALKK
jgi:arylsulfatase A-like enzyme